MRMTSEKKKIVDRLITNCAEVITEQELRERLASGQPLTHYIGFEISGYVHIGQGLMSALVMKDLMDVGVTCTVWLADWHTWINDKLDGTKETAARIGQGYFTEAIKASLLAVGADVNAVQFRLASEWYQKDALHYMELEKLVEQHTTLARIQRSISIMGRKEGESVDFASLTYPGMQAADVFYQKIDIAHAGMDQRKAHVIMRDTADKAQPERPKPIALHHSLLPGLQKPTTWPIPEDVNERDVVIEMKMSKSKSNSAIWVHDSEEEIQQKIKQAFCPEKEIKYNPILSWVGHVLFWNRDKPFSIERKLEHGGTISFDSFSDLESAYGAGDVHPMDLKAAVAREFIDLLAPVREHFARPEIAAMKSELDQVLANK